MHLFLTSSPCDNQVPEGCTLPCIYYTKNQFVANLQRCFTPGCSGVMIASSPDRFGKNDLMAQTFRDCFAWHGMPFRSFTMIDYRNTEQAARAIADSGVVILSGGHVPTENSFFKELHLKELLHGYKGIVMGISAGTMNACTTVYAQPEEPGEATNPAYKRFIPGLGLTDVQILPHYQMVKDYLVDGLHLFRDISIPDSVGHTFYALPDASYVLQSEGHATLYGESWILQDGTMRKFSEDGDVTQLF